MSSPPIGTYAAPISGANALQSSAAVEEYSNPGKDAASPENINTFLTVDKERAFSNINAYWVLTQKLAEPKTILDISCGPGYSTSVLADLSNRESIIVGVDRRSDNVAFANGHYANGLDNLSYDVLESPYILPPSPDGKGWERVSAFAFFSWVPLDEHQPVLKAIFDAMADGGELLVRTTAEGDRPYREAATTVSQMDNWINYFDGYQAPSADQTAGGFKVALEQSGYSEIDTSSRVDRFFFPTKDGMVNYFLQWLPELSRIVGKTQEDTDSLRLLFTREVIDEYCRLIQSTGKAIYLDFPAVYANARAVKTDRLTIATSSILV